MNYKSLIFRLFFVGIFVFLLKIVYNLAIWLVFTDISIEPIDKQACVEINNSDFNPRLPVTLISYADGHEIFYKNQNFQVFSGLNKGIDQFILYKRNMIDPEFYRKNAHILKEKQGAGYWLWKPQIILQTMKMMPKDSVIIYADVGFSLKNTLQPIFDALKNNDIVIAEDGAKSSEFPHLEMITSQSTLTAVDINLKEGEHIKPLWAALIVIKNTKRAQKFIEAWLYFCQQKHLITQRMNDQMLLGLLAYKFHKDVYTMPEQVVSDIFEWHHRKPNTNPKDTLMPCLLKHVGSFQGKLVNSKIFHLFRDFALTHLTNIQNRLRKTAISKVETN